jgi:hypothetical protein
VQSFSWLTSEVFTFFVSTITLLSAVCRVQTVVLWWDAGGVWTILRMYAATSSVFVWNPWPIISGPVHVGGIWLLFLADHLRTVHVGGIWLLFLADNLRTVHVGGIWLLFLADNLRTSTCRWDLAVISGQYM